MDVQKEQLEEQQQPSMQQEQDYDNYEEDYDDYDDYLDDELNDADWDNATGGKIMRHPWYQRRYWQATLDFTKQYNRLRQQVNAVHAPTTAKPIVPAVNHKRPELKNNNTVTATNTTTTPLEDKKQALDTQIESLGHFASRIHVSDYVPGSNMMSGSRKANGER